MGVYDALSTAVAGLQAQAYALENISGNIANSSTTGYKSVETSFEDMLTTSGLSSSTTTSGSVGAVSSSTNSVQGSITSATTGTYLAISGSGYFQVVASTGTSDGQTVLGSALYYTRQGDFTMNSDGYLVNSAGYYLTGLSIDSSTGSVTGSTAEPIRISTSSIPAKATTTIGYSANLPSDSSVATLGDSSDYSNSANFPTEIAADDATTFLSSSLSGGSVTVYDASGNDVDVQLRWAKSDTGDWTLYYQSDSSATGGDAEWTAVDQTFSFDESGNLTSPSSTSLTLSNFTVDGSDLGDVTLSLSGGLTRYASDTTVSDVDITQNGYAAGTYSSLSISDGIVQATYTNGQTLDLYQIGVYTFSGEDNLLAVSGNAWQATSESGGATLSSTATIESSALESSNVDITDQFSKLIVTQQAYSANSKVMQTANEMMKTLIDIVT